MNNTIIGTRIAELRKSAGEKQEDLAEVLGCNRGSLANYETGKRTPDAEIIIKTAQHYGTTTDYILGMTDTKENDTTMQKICNYTGLSDKSVHFLHLINEISKTNEDSAPKQQVSLFFRLQEAYYDDFVGFVKSCLLMSILIEQIIQSNKLHAELSEGINEYLSLDKNTSPDEIDEFKKRIASIITQITVLENKISELKANISEEIFSFICSYLRTSENIDFEETKINALKNLSKDKLSLLAFFHLGIDNEKKETEEPSENKTENMLFDIFDDIFKSKGDDKREGNE